MHSLGRNGKSLSFTLKTMRELSGSVESSQLVLGYGVNNITFFIRPEPYEREKKVL